MQKSILISIQPQHVFNILTGKKTLELRKSVPKDFEGCVYIYCTKSNPSLIRTFEVDTGERTIKGKFYSLENMNQVNDRFYQMSEYERLNGKVVARFWFDGHIKLEYHKKNEVLMWDNNYYYYTEDDNTYCNVECILDELCLEHQQVLDYGKGKDLYAWHIKKIEVFDRPMELSDFYKDNHYPDGESIGPQICTPTPFDYDDDYKTCLKSFEVKKAPQSWMYVYTNEQLP